MKEIPIAFWNFSGQALLAQLETTPQGLTRNEAQQRLEQEGANRLKSSRRSASLSLFLAQFQSPIILILIAAAVLSFALQDAAAAKKYFY
jgi:Mg2+-importing ATPase